MLCHTSSLLPSVFPSHHKVSCFQDQTFCTSFPSPLVIRSITYQSSSGFQEKSILNLPISDIHDTVVEGFNQFLFHLQATCREMWKCLTLCHVQCKCFCISLAWWIDDLHCVSVPWRWLTWNWLVPVKYGTQQSLLQLSFIGMTYAWSWVHGEVRKCGNFSGYQGYWGHNMSNPISLGGELWEVGSVSIH